MSKAKTAKPTAARIQPLLWALEHGANAVKEAMGRPDQAVYTRHAMALLDNPALIGRPEWHAILVKILQSYVARHPPRELTSDEIAFLVEHECLVRPEVPLPEARRVIAQATGKREGAVKKAHNRSRGTNGRPLVPRSR